MLFAAILRLLPMVCLVVAFPVRSWPAPAQDRAGILHARYAEQMQAGKYAEALETIAALRKLQPNSVAVAEREGMTCFAMQRWIDAVVAFRRAIKLGSKDPVVRQMQAEALCAVAADRLSDGDEDGAHRLWVEAMEAAPAYASTPYNHGLAYLRSGRDYQHAVDELSKAVALAPDWPDPLFHRARAHEAMGETEQAVADYKAALKLAPDWTECRQALLHAYTASGDFQGAVDCCGEQIQQAEGSQDSASWYGHRAGAYLQLGQYQQALNDFSTASSLSPDVPAARWLAGRAVARFYLQDEKYARQDFSLAADRLAAEEVSAGDRANGLATIAWRMLEVNWLQEGLDVARKAVAAQETAEALRSLSALLVLSGQGEEAGAVARKLEAAEPAAPLTGVLVACAEALSGGGAQAVAQLRESAAAAQTAGGWSEDLAWLWYFVGVGYKAAGDQANAAKATERAFELMPRLKVGRTQ